MTRSSLLYVSAVLTLSFVSLSPIPELKLTDQGLIDAVRLRKTELFAR